MLPRLLIGVLVVSSLMTGCTLLSPPLPPKEKTEEELLLEVAKRVPEFGGMSSQFEEDVHGYSFYIYLLDPAKGAEAEAAIEATFGKDFLRLVKRVQILQAQYSFSQLWQWRGRIAEQKIAEINRVIADITTNRLVVWIKRSETQQSIEQELERLGIPREAVIFTIELSPQYPELERWLEVPSEARVGERVTFKLRIKNVSQHTLYLPLPAAPPYNFSVSKSDGTVVWCLAGIVTDKILCDRWSSDNSLHNHLLKPVILEPAGELEFTAAWDQHDYNGNPVLPGSYKVHGTLVVKSWWDERLETEPRLLIIK